MAERDAGRRETDEEIRLHMELRARQLMEQGWGADAAWAEAERRFGATEGARRSLYRAARRRDRRARVREGLDAARQDSTMAVRTLRREPAFALVVILTMALGIGANAAMFGVLDRLLLRGPDHVQRPESLVHFYAERDDAQFGNVRTDRFGYVTYAALRDGATRAFEGVAAWRVTDGILGMGAEAQPIRLGAATSSFFPLLGVSAERGRFFDAEEDATARGAAVVVLSHETWRGRFAGNPEVVGTTVMLGGEAYTVIGVAPRGFTGADLTPVDAWIPMSRSSRGISPDWPTTWEAQWLRVVARLAPDVASSAAEEAATGAWLAAREGQSSRSGPPPRLASAPLGAGPAGEEPLETSVARWLVGVAAVVLLIACANVMNLLLARGSRRRRETAVRVALGIGRGRLAGLILAETLLLVLLGGAAGLLLAFWGGSLIRSVLLPQVAWTTSPVDGRVILFTLVVTLVTGALTAVLPALRFAGRADPANVLRTGGREAGGRSRLRTGLTVAQAALSVVLLVGAGLFVRSLDNALSADLGLDADAVLVVQMHWPNLPPGPGDVSLGATESVPDAPSAARLARIAFFDRALERLRGLPGVEHAAISVGTPFHTAFGVDLRVAGRDSVPDLLGGGPYIAAVSPGFFETIGTSLLRGRTFEPGEGAGTEPVAIVNETMARTLWPGEEALGQCLMIGDAEAPPCSRVVGVVEESRRFSLREDAAMQYYVPLGQEQGFGGRNLLIRPRAADAAIVPRLRSLLQEIDVEGGYVRIESLRASLDPQVRPWRLGMLLFSVFGVLALIIAAVGMYSVVAYGVAQRTREMGVRMVLGARRADVRGMVLRQGAGVAVGGVCLGMLVAVGAGGAAEALLFDVSPRDPWVLGGVAVLLVGVSLVASWIPALRATRVDPVVALRAD